MIEHHVYWALIGARWVDDENFAKGPAHFFDGAPEHRREKLREDAQFRVAENYLLSGLGRHAPDEDIDLAARSLFALSVQLGDKPYLMGDTPCGTDATAFGALAGILTPFFASQLQERTEEFGNLTSYVDRMMLQYYPDFAWMPLRQRGVKPNPRQRTCPSKRRVPPPVRRSARRVWPAPPRRRRRRIFAGCAAGNWCPTRRP